MRIIVLALMSLPLAGCFGVAWPPPPLPDWAMHPQAAVHGQAEPSGLAGIRPRRPASRRAAREVSTSSRVVPVTTLQDDVLPFTPAWQAREEANDAQLRRSMNICRNC